MTECARALGMLSQFVDRDLPVEQSAWLDRHLETCGDCRAALARFAELDGQLTGWGATLSRRNPAVTAMRERVAARMNPAPAGRTAMRWIPAAAAVIAAAIALTAVLPQKKAPAPADDRGDAEFIGIPYLPPPDPHENTVVVRMNIKVATLIAIGYKVTADPDKIVPADVLVGEDGRAHAVRVLTDIAWNGAGD